MYESLPWLLALIDNKEKYASKDTNICFHLNLATNYSKSDLIMLKNKSILLNPHRIVVKVGDGSIFMGHLMNYKYANSRTQFSHIIFASSNMFWIRKGIEQYVYRFQHSVGLEGIRHKTLTAPLHMRKSNVYNVISKNHTKELWSYHEGTFYPNAVVGRFLTFLSDKFDDDYLIAHPYFPEEFWLQTYMLNFEQNYSFHRQSRPLCWRIPGPKSNPRDSIVTHDIIDNLSCRYYAIKRVLRDLSFLPTIRIQNLSNQRCTAVRPRVL